MKHDGWACSDLAKNYLTYHVTRGILYPNNIWPILDDFLTECRCYGGFFQDGVAILDCLCQRPVLMQVDSGVLFLMTLSNGKRWPFPFEMVMKMWQTFWMTNSNSWNGIPRCNLSSVSHSIFWFGTLSKVKPRICFVVSHTSSFFCSLWRDKGWVFFIISIHWKTSWRSTITSLATCLIWSWLLLQWT